MDHYDTPCNAIDVPMEPYMIPHTMLYEYPQVFDEMLGFKGCSVLARQPLVQRLVITLPISDDLPVGSAIIIPN